jgi:hypothetical protein
LDHIFVSSDIEVTGTFTVRTLLTRVASDHLPIVAELRIQRPSAAESKPARGVAPIERSDRPSLFSSGA